MGIADVQLDEKIEQKITVPRRYKVIVLNDNSTPIDFVIAIMTTIFRHTEETATDLTMQIHHKGSAVAGVYSYEVAEQKVTESTHSARSLGYPLQLKIEQE